MRRKKRLLLLLLLLIAVAAFFLVLRGRPLRFPKGIVIHHSASRMFEGDRPIGVEDVSRWHARRSLGKIFRGKVYHVGYHFIIRADGKIERGLPENCWGSHATRGNDCLGICLIGDFSSRDNPRGKKGPLTPTRLQMDALVSLCRSLLDKYHLPVSSIRTHRQVDGDTECPGDCFPFSALLAELRRRARDRE
jgi:hypothetical protein